MYCIKAIMDFYIFALNIFPFNSIFCMNFLKYPHKFKMNEDAHIQFSKKAVEGSLL